VFSGPSALRKAQQASDLLKDVCSVGRNGVLKYRLLEVFTTSVRLWNKVEAGPKQSKYVTRCSHDVAKVDVNVGVSTLVDGRIWERTIPITGSAETAARTSVEVATLTGP
jgi:hypothetical protein